MTQRHDSEGPPTPEKASAWRQSPLVWALAAAVLAFLVLTIPYLLQGPQTVILGDETATPRLSGFYQIEDGGGQPFRWSGPEGEIVFENIANRPLQIHLLMHALRPDKAATVGVSVNGRAIERFPAGGAFADYLAQVGRPAVGWDGEVVVELQADPFVAPPDERELGVALASISLEPEGLLALPPWPLLWPLLLSVAILALALPRTRLGFWGTAAAIVIVSLLYSAAAQVAGARLAEIAWLAPLAVAAFSVLLLFAPRTWRRLRRTLGRGRNQHPVLFWSLIMLILALPIYLRLSHTVGYRGDMEIYMAWTYQITNHGIHSVYSPDFVSPPNTTPLLMYPFRFVGELFRRIYSPDFPPTWEARAYIDQLRYMLRLPGLLAVALITIILYRVTRRAWGYRMGLIVAAAYLFNPAVVFESAYYGQTGGVHALFMLVAVIAIVQGRPGAAWASETAGMLTKPQAYVFAPLLGVLTLRRFGLRGAARAAVAALATAILILLPFLLNGTLGEMWARISVPASYHPILSATAHNLWWFASFGNGKASDLGILPPFDALGWSFLTYRWIGLGLFGLAYLLVLARTWRDESGPALYESAAYLFFAFFMLATQIHENHLIPAFSLLALAAPRNRKLWAIYGVLAITSTLNMALHYPAILEVLVPQNPDIWGGAELFWPRWLNSLAQLLVFGYWTALFVRATGDATGTPIRITHQVHNKNTETLTTAAKT